MDDIKELIKDLVDYLDDVYHGDKILNKDTSFFVSPKELERMLRKYFLFFENNNELISSVKKKYNDIKDMSFPYEADSHCKLRQVDSKGKSIPTAVHYKTEQHNNHAHIIHSHLIHAFEDKLGIKKNQKKTLITVRNKKVGDLVKRLYLELEFLREDCTPGDFINALTRRSDINIYINIDNRSFHYLLTKIKEYFFNFTITAVAKTNKIHSKRGTLLNASNLISAKDDYPSLKDRIDEVFKNFK